MIKCPFCQVSHVYNTLFCSECGYYLLENENRETDPLDTADIGPKTDTRDKETTPCEPELGTELQVIRLRIGRRHEIEIPSDKVIHIGRVDPALDVFPEVDLSNHAPAKSISRRHARIIKKDETIFVEDLGSINGTFLNGRVLNAYLPEPLNDGDVLQLGDLLIEVNFKTPSYA